MRITLALAGLLAASTCWAQEPAQNPPQAQSPAAVAAQSQTIIVPAGTRIPLSLTSPIYAKSKKPGGSVRAVTDFPVTVGTQVAIPVGTYFQGVIDKINLRGRSGPSVKMHFTSIVFPNGYTLAVNGATTDASAEAPPVNPAAESAFANPGGGKFGMMGQNAVSPPPLPQVGPSPGKIAAIAVSIFVASVVGLILLARHHGIPANAIVLDTGWQFEIALQSPLDLDAQSIAAPAAGAQ
jgi:hypothetical protein